MMMPKLDRNVSAMIEMLAVDKIKDVQACGRAAIKGLLVQAAKRNLRATNIDCVPGRYAAAGFGGWVWCLYVRTCRKSTAFRS